MRLADGDVVLVTGGASGLGLATVRALIATGARAVILDLPSSSGAEVAAELGDRVRFVAADVRDEEQVQAAVDAAAGMGVIRVAVSCAGVATPGRVIGKRGLLPLEAFRTVVEINLVGTFNVLRLAAAGHARERAGRRRPRPGGDDRERGGVRRADRAGGVLGQQGRSGLADLDRGPRPGAARDPGDDHRPRGDGDPDDGRDAGGDQEHPGGAGAAPAAARSSGGVRAAGGGDRRQPAAQRRGDPAGRGAPAAAATLPRGCLPRRVAPFQVARAAGSRATDGSGTDGKASTRRRSRSTRVR